MVLFCRHHAKYMCAVASVSRFPSCPSENPFSADSYSIADQPIILFRENLLELARPLNLQ